MIYVQIVLWIVSIGLLIEVDWRLAVAVLLLVINFVIAAIKGVMQLAKEEDV